MMAAPGEERPERSKWDTPMPVANRYLVWIIWVMVMVGASGWLFYWLVQSDRIETWLGQLGWAYLAFVTWGWLYTALAIRAEVARAKQAGLVRCEGPPATQYVTESRRQVWMQYLLLFSGLVSWPLLLAAREHINAWWWVLAIMGVLLLSVEGLFAGGRYTYARVLLPAQGRRHDATPHEGASSAPTDGGD